MALTPLEALAKLKAAIQDGGIETPAEGFLTITQWCEQTGGSPAHIARTLKLGVEAGIVEKATYRIRTGKIVAKVAHYRYIEVPVSRKGKK